MASYLDNAYGDDQQPADPTQQQPPPQTAVAPSGTSMSLTPALIQRVIAEMAARQQQQPAPPLPGAGLSVDQLVGMLHELRLATGRTQ